jgi:pimeloyl-ACP methyl ester carboxylesterase
LNLPPTKVEPRMGAVQCMSPAGLHSMRYAEWGDPRNPRVLVCVHGLTRCGRDFDRLGQALQGELRVVCPDVVGCGASDWLRDPTYYAVPQYVADMVTLIARLDVPKVAWLGTSMGGLIGMGLAGLPGTPVERLVLNDVGIRLDPMGTARIAASIARPPARFASLEEATQYLRTVSPGYALRNDQQWREITAPLIKPDGEGFVFRYDPGIAVNVRAATPQVMQAGERTIAALYDAIACPTLLVRGALSDVLTEETVRDMAARGPRPRVHTFAGVGHAPMLLDPDQIEVIGRFLRD